MINSELPPHTMVTKNGMPNLSVTIRFANRKMAVIAAMATELVKSRFVAKFRMSIKAINQVGVRHGRRTIPFFVYTVAFNNLPKLNSPTNLFPSGKE
mgnify:CR=1 FL=1